jgi:hypothetical protein
LKGDKRLEEQVQVQENYLLDSNSNIDDRIAKDNVRIKIIRSVYSLEKNVMGIKTKVFGNNKNAYQL